MPKKFLEFPELPANEVPTFNPVTWALIVEGEVKKPLKLKYGEILFLRKESRLDDFSGVEGYPMSVRWEGFPVRYLLSLTQPEDEATYVHFCANEYGLTVSIPDVLEHNPLLAYKMNDKTLPTEYGGPLRLLLDDGEALKSVKWVNKVEITNTPERN
jgi:DMSO/TMAO reductase YedYZ molybdopterin-dependent catalytic subunit